MERSARPGDQLAGACDFVGRVELEPDVLSVAQSRKCRRRVALGESQRALGMGDDRVQHRAVEPLGKLAELATCSPRFLDLARGEGDLGLGREERRPLERLRHLGVRAADCGKRGLGLSLREAKLREAGLRFPAEATRLAVRLRGCVELALEP